MQKLYREKKSMPLKATLLGCFGEWSALLLPAKLPMGSFEPNRELAKEDAFEKKKRGRISSNGGKNS